MKWKLDAEHYLWDQLLQAGTEIGTDTAYPVPDGFAPSASMTPLDDEAKNFTKEWGEQKQNWGRPEDNLSITPEQRAAQLPGDHHAIINPQTINRQNQPIIPPPLEHLTHPSNMKPGETGRQNPLVEEALRKQNEEMAAENDKRMAEEANRQADARSKENLPRGVTIENVGANARARPEQLPGQGPVPKSSTQQGIPGQGPTKKPDPPLDEVLRNTSRLLPENPDGRFKKPSEEKK